MVSNRLLEAGSGEVRTGSSISSNPLAVGSTWSRMARKWRRKRKSGSCLYLLSSCRCFLPQGMLSLSSLQHRAFALHLSTFAEPDIHGFEAYLAPYI